jgi:hypothetical protein
VPTGDSRFKHLVLQSRLCSRPCEVVINSVAVTEKVQKISIGVGRHLFQLGISSSWRSLLSDEHEADSNFLTEIPTNFIPILLAYLPRGVRTFLW